MKKKVLFVMHELRLGGAERVMVNLANNFEDENTEVHFCIFRNRGQLISSLAPNIEFHCLNSSRVLTGTYSLAKLILKIQPDLILSSITHVNLLLSILKIFPGFRKFNFVSREPNNPSIRAKHIKKSKLLDTLYSRTINNFNKVIAQSEYMKEDILNSYKIRERKIKVIPNPLDTGYIDWKLIQKNDSPLFPSNKIKLLAVGGLRKQKNFSFLVESMKHLNEKFHLTIIGEGEERNLLEEVISENGLADKVTLLGEISNPYIYMEEADLLCMTSHYEGFPNVVLEANYCGTFALALRAPGVNEEVIINEVNGVLVEDYDKKHFSAMVEKYSQQKFSKQEIKNTIERYKVKNIVKKYKELI